MKTQNPPSTLLYTINIDKNKESYYWRTQIMNQTSNFINFIRMAQASLNNLPEISYTGQGDNIKSTNGYYKTEIATLMPPTSYLWARGANTGTDHL